MTLALKTVARMNKKEFPKACEIIDDNTYVDDIIDSLHSFEDVCKTIFEIETVLRMACFKVKGWAISGKLV